MDILTKTDKLEYNRARANYMRRVISEIGIIEEKDDRIICHVKQGLLEKNLESGYYQLLCDGMNTERDEEREKVDYFNLNKPVYYIFDGICFDNIVEIAASFSSVIFRNCTFSNGIRICYADDITLENNKYNGWTDSKEYYNAFLCGLVRNLTIKKGQFVNGNFNSQFFDNNFGINIEVNKLNIDSATICAGNHGQINIKAKETTIRKSELKAPEICLDSDNIVFDDKSSMESDGIIIENKNCDLDTDMIFRNMDSPCIIYNGTEMETNNKIFKEKRLALVNVLTNVMIKCNQDTLVKSASVKEEK